MPKTPTIYRRTLGYSLIVATLVVGYGIWIWSMWAAHALYENPWKYPAKIGSHGTLMLMCWAFILATRFRPVEWLFGGLDKVYKAHRYVGEAAFFLIFLHPIFLAVALSDDVGGFFRYLWFSGDWVRNTGIIAFLAFVFLVVVSIYVKIPYHKWKRTHDFFGLLLVLIVVHAVISEGEIMAFPWLAAWHGAWVLIGLSAYVYIRLLYRFIGPQYDVVTTEVKEVGDNVTEVYLEPTSRPFHPQPGQFIYISFDADAVTEEPHPFSLSSPPEAPQIRVSIKRLGDWTHNVGDIRKGELARVWGPYGHFGEALLRRPNFPAVLVGGGIGITPFLSIIQSEAFSRRKGTAVLFYSGPRNDSLVYDKEITATAGQLEEFTYISHISDEEGFMNRAYFEKSLPRPIKEYLFLVCGPGPMMEAFRNFLRDADVPRSQIVMEDFAIR